MPDTGIGIGASLVSVILISYILERNLGFNSEAIWSWVCKVPEVHAIESVN